MDDISALKAQVAALAARSDALAARVDSLEDAAAIRKLHYVYGYLIDYCMYADVVELFADDGEVLFLSGVYRGHTGIARLYQTWFQTLFTQGVDGPVDGMLLDHFQMQDVITVAPDGQTAQGRFRALLAGGSHTSRAYQPEGLPAQFWEAGLYENSYVKQNGVWKIQQLDYVVQWQADYESGWAHQEAHLQPQMVTYPENPLGPDALLPVKRPAWPARSALRFHFAHPVNARRLGPA